MCATLWILPLLAMADKAYKTTKKANKKIKRNIGLPWLRGGSTAHPAKDAMKKPAGRVTKAKQGSSAKHGYGMLQRRGAASLKKRPAGVLKRPSIPYTPPNQQKDTEKVTLRDIAARSKVKLEDIMKLKSQIGVIRLLLRGKHLRTPVKCPHCPAGKLTPLSKRGEAWVWRCRWKKCQKWIPASHGSKVIRGGRGGVGLQQKAGILFCAVWRVPQAYVPALIRGVTKHSVGTVYADWRGALAKFMDKTQEEIKFGNFPDQDELPEQIETDEFVVRKEQLLDEDGNPVVQWHEYVHMKRRGDRKSLYLAARSHEHSISRPNSKGFCVPPPYSKAEWVPFAEARAVTGAKALDHTDGAITYKSYQPSNWGHDSVAHGRSKARGGPEFTGKRSHATASGKTQEVLGGTQSLDSIGGHLKKGAYAVNARFQERIDERMREGQWHHWVRFEDRWEAAGFVLSQL